MKTRITRDELRARLDAGTPTILFEALPEKYYRDGHLPGALPINHENVRNTAVALVPDKNATVVVYCASATSTTLLRQIHLAQERLEPRVCGKTFQRHPV